MQGKVNILSKRDVGDLSSNFSQHQLRLLMDRPSLSDTDWDKNDKVLITNSLVFLCYMN